MSPAEILGWGLSITFAILTADVIIHFAKQYTACGKQVKQ